MLEAVNKFLIHQADVQHPKLTQSMHWEPEDWSFGNQVLFVPLLLFAAHGESQEAKPEEEGEGYGGMTPRLSADTEALH